MKYIKTFTIAAMGLALSTGFVNAQDNNASAFPADVATTELTPAQKKEASKLVLEARDIYADILNDKNEGKIEYLTSQADFIKKRLVKIEEKLKAKEAVLSGLNQKVLKKQNDIASLKSDDATKAQMRIELVDEFREAKEMLNFRITTLKKQQKALKASAKKINLELANLDSIPEKKVSDLEKADNALSDIKKQEQNRRAKLYEDLRPSN